MGNVVSFGECFALNSKVETWKYLQMSNLELESMQQSNLHGWKNE